MTDSLSTVEIGLQSLEDLSAAFISTLKNQHYNGEIVCGIDNDSSTTTTTFHLDFYNENDAACAGSDWIILGVLTALSLIVSWGTRWLIFEPIANWKMQNAKHWNRDECRRFSMTCASCLNFVLSALFGYRVLIQMPWLFRREEWLPGEIHVAADFKFYYLLYAARFIGDLVSLFFESRQMDAFVAAFIHHLVTLGLVLGSAHARLTRFGGVIMFFFDWADIPLLCAKACKYLSQDPQDTLQIVANRLFELFAVLFFATRCVFFNYVVYCVWMNPSDTRMFDWCKYLLLILVGLQTYWMALIVRMAVRISKNGGVAEDSRDDDLRKLSNANARNDKPKSQ